MIKKKKTPRSYWKRLPVLSRSVLWGGTGGEQLGFLFLPAAGAEMTKGRGLLHGKEGPNPVRLFCLQYAIILHSSFSFLPPPLQQKEKAQLCKIFLCLCSPSPPPSPAEVVGPVIQGFLAIPLPFSFFLPRPSLNSCSPSLPAMVVCITALHYNCQKHGERP